MQHWADMDFLFDLLKMIIHSEHINITPIMAEGRQKYF